MASLIGVRGSGKITTADSTCMVSRSDSQAVEPVVAGVTPYKLMHVVTVPGTLGFFRGQFDYFRHHGYHISVVASPEPNFGTMLEELSVTGYGIEMQRGITPWSDLKSLIHLWRLFRRERPHIVGGHTPKGGFLSMFAAWLARVPVRVYHLHGLRFETERGLRRRVLMLTERLACVFAHRVIAVSESVREQAIRYGICSKCKITVLCHGSINGVDAEKRFNPVNVDPQARERLCQQYDIPQDAVIVGFIGRITKDKGIVELVQAWKTISESMPEAHLVVVGEFEPDNRIPTDVVEILKSDPKIHLLGRVKNMPEIYRSVDVVVLPTHREGLGQVILEASAMERPVVTTDATGVRDAVVHGQTGLIVPVGDVQALARAILTYLSDPDLRRQHGRAGRTRVLEYFRPEDVWKALLLEYERLVKEHIVRN